MFMCRTRNAKENSCNDGEPGVFVGYDNQKKAWRIAVRRHAEWKIVSSVDVHFIENKRGHMAIMGHADPRTELPPIINVGITAYDPDYEPSHDNSGLTSSTRSGEQSQTPMEAEDRTVLTGLQHAQPATVQVQQTPAEIQQDADEGYQTADEDNFASPGQQVGSPGQLALPAGDAATPAQSFAGTASHATEQQHSNPSLQHNNDLFGDMELSAGEEAHSPVAETPVLPVVPEDIHWHTNAATEMLQAEATQDTGLRRSSRKRFQRTDDYVDRFIEGKTGLRQQTGARQLPTAIPQRRQHAAQAVQRGTQRRQPEALETQQAPQVMQPATQAVQHHSQEMQQAVQAVQQPPQPVTQEERAQGEVLPQGETEQTEQEQERNGQQQPAYTFCKPNCK